MNDYKKVRPGDPLRMPAAAYNTLMDMAATHAGRHEQTARPRAGGDAGKVLVKNSSGQDLPRFAVLGIGDVLIDPAANLDRFCNQVAFDGVAPTTDHLDGRFVITAEPIRDGKIGRAWASGCCPAYINMAYEQDQYANVRVGDAAMLHSMPTGPISILWAQAGTGEKWAVVRFGGSSDAEMYRVVSIVTDKPGCYYCVPVRWQYESSSGVLWQSDAVPALPENYVVCQNVKEFVSGHYGHQYREDELFWKLGSYSDAASGAYIVLVKAFTAEISLY